MTSRDAQSDRSEDRAEAGETPVFAARDLLGPDGVGRIEHDGQVYVLRLTRNNRLILTK